MGGAQVQHEPKTNCLPSALPGTDLGGMGALLLEVNDVKTIKQISYISVYSLIRSFLYQQLG